MLRRKLVIAAVIALFAMTLVTTSALVCAALSVGQKAPDFNLTSFDGKTLKLTDYSGKPTVLVFWASWCPHCVRELPVMDKMYRDLGPKGANFVGINLDSQTNAGRDFVKSHRISFPMAAARAGVGETYQITGIPSIFIIDKSGMIRAKYAGEVDEATVRSDLAKLGAK